MHCWQSNTYHPFVLFGSILLAISYFVWRTGAHRDSERLLGVLNLASIVVGLGFVASFGAAWLEYYLETEALKWALAGEKWFGAYLLVALVFLLVRPSAAFGNNHHRYFDQLSTTIALGYIGGKIACFVSGHYGCYGLPTDLPWGMVYCNAEHTSEVAVHPVQLYDAAFHIILLLVFWCCARFGYEGFGVLFLLLHPIYNFDMEFLRTSLRIGLGLTPGQYFYIASFVVCLLITFRYGLSFRKVARST